METFCLCLTGYTSGVSNSGGLKARHGAMGPIAWGVLLPRYFKHHDPQWFYLHILIQIVSFLLDFATVVVGRTLYNGLESDRICKFKIQTPRILSAFPQHSSGLFWLGLGLYSTLTKYISSSMLKTKFTSSQVMALNLSLLQVMLKTSLGRETCSLLGSSEYCDWTLSGRSRPGAEKQDMGFLYPSFL